MQSNQIPPTLTQNALQTFYQLPKIKPFFPIKTNLGRLMPSNIAYMNKCKPKMLKILEITDCHDPEDPTQGVRNLRRALTGTKIISSLVFGKEHWTNFPQPTDYLEALLSSCSHYKRIFFRIQGKRHEQALNENTIQNLTRLRRCKDLSSLKVHFSCHEETKDKLINRLSQQLRGLKKLKILNINTDHCKSYTYRATLFDYDPNAQLFIFKYPSSLSSLTLHFESAISVNQQMLSIFISNLQRCNQLKSLNLNSFRILANEASSLSLIWGPLFKNSSLKFLTLFSHFTDDNIHPFLDSFSHLKNLTALDLQISSYLSVKQFEFFTTTLYSHLASFPNFKSLTVRTSTMNESYPESHFLFPPSHQNLQQLEHLQIDFPPVADLKKSHLQYSSQSLQSLHCLKKLDLSFPTSRISLEGIISLAQSLKDLKSLRDLSLKFFYANLNSKSIQILFDSMAHLPLKNLSLHLGEPKIGLLANLWKERPILTPLFSALYGFNLLTRLHLNLSAFKLSTAEAKHFSLSLKELKQLCKFSITLPEFDPENKYEGLRSFLSSFKEMPKLSSLKMFFIEERMGDEEVKFLAENLQGCRHLRTLNLNFDEADQLAEDSLHHLSIGLKGLFLLKELRLSFIREEALSNESTFELLESLTTLKYLESFHFHSSSSLSVYSQDVMEFAKNLINQQKFKNLTNFTINHCLI